MTQTSESYNFVNDEKIVDFIRESFQKCGISIEELSGYQLVSAKKSLNYIFSHWVNLGLNLWAVDAQGITLIPGQNTYALAPGTIDVIDDNEGIIVQPLRVLTDDGVASASSGTAANAFDDDLTTACTQNAPNGWIEYDFGAGNETSIPYIGITSFVDSTYTIAVQTSLDNVNWTTYNQPQQLSYKQLQTNWIIPYGSPLTRYIRILETGGSTLNIAELIFSVKQMSKVVKKVSRQVWVTYPSPTIADQITAFTVQKQINPVLQVYPIPSANTLYNLFVYYRQRQIQDVNDFISNVDAPQRFFMALSDALAYELSVKFKPERSDMLMAKAARTFIEASMADREWVPTTFSLS